MRAGTCCFGLAELGWAGTSTTNTFSTHFFGVENSLQICSDFDGNSVKCQNQKISKIIALKDINAKFSYNAQRKQQMKKWWNEKFWRILLIFNIWTDSDVLPSFCQAFESSFLNRRKVVFDVNYMREFEHMSNCQPSVLANESIRFALMTFTIRTTSSNIVPFFTHTNTHVCTPKHPHGWWCWRIAKRRMRERRLIWEKRNDRVKQLRAILCRMKFASTKYVQLSRHNFRFAFPIA